MEIKPLGSDIWTKVEGAEHKAILTNKNPKDTPAMKEGKLLHDAILGEEKFIGVSEVAEMLDITVDRVRYLSRLNRIPSFTLRDRGTRIYEKEKIMELVHPF